MARAATAAPCRSRRVSLTRKGPATSRNYHCHDPRGFSGRDRTPSSNAADRYRFLLMDVPPGACSQCGPAAWHHAGAGEHITIPVIAYVIATHGVTRGRSSFPSMSSCRDWSTMCSSRLLLGRASMCRCRGPDRRASSGCHRGIIVLSSPGDFGDRLTSCSGNGSGTSGGRRTRRKGGSLTRPFILRSGP